MLDNSSNHTILEKLIEASTFGLDDLLLNRQGRMSGLQRSRLGLMAVIYSGISALLFALALAALSLFLKPSLPIPFLAVLFWVLFTSSAASYWLSQAIPMWQDVRSGRVSRVTGPLRKIYTEVANGRSRIGLGHYKIARKLFDVAFYAPKLMRQDQSCHGYYTQKSEILVGIEPV